MLNVAIVLTSNASSLGDMYICIPADDGFGYVWVTCHGIERVGVQSCGSAMPRGVSQTVASECLCNAERTPIKQSGRDSGEHGRVEGSQEDHS